MKAGNVVKYGWGNKYTLYPRWRTGNKLSEANRLSGIPQEPVSVAVESPVS